MGKRFVGLTRDLCCLRERRGVDKLRMQEWFDLLSALLVAGLLDKGNEILVLN